MNKEEIKGMFSEVLKKEAEYDKLVDTTSTTEITERLEERLDLLLSFSPESELTEIKKMKSEKQKLVELKRLKDSTIQYIILKKNLECDVLAFIRFLEHGLLDLKQSLEHDFPTY